jgi:hypothetical protein
MSPRETMRLLGRLACTASGFIVAGGFTVGRDGSIGYQVGLGVVSLLGGTWLSWRGSAAGETSPRRRATETAIWAASSFIGGALAAAVVIVLSGK